MLCIYFKLSYTVWNIGVCYLSLEIIYLLYLLNMVHYYIITRKNCTVFNFVPEYYCWRNIALIIILWCQYIDFWSFLSSRTCYYSDTLNYLLLFWVSFHRVLVILPPLYNVLLVINLPVKNPLTDPQSLLGEYRPHFDIFKIYDLMDAYNLT